MALELDTDGMFWEPNNTCNE